jgi:hypothetical protein
MQKFLILVGLPELVILARKGWGRSGRLKAGPFLTPPCPLKIKEDNKFK